MISDVTGFMIDMDGTVYRGGEVIPGSVEFIDSLRAAGIPFVFLTNNSSNPRSYYHRKLKGMGFEVYESEIITSNIASIRYVSEMYPGSTLYPIASDPVKEELVAAGIHLTETDPDVVYLTFDKTIDYYKINNGYHYLLKGAKLVATHPDELCPTADSYDVDIGPFIRLFESVSDCKAEVVGKPNKLMLEMAAMEMGVDVNGTVMVGDRMYTDMKMAVDANIRSILVLTGETSRGDLAKYDLKPTIVLDSVAQIPSSIGIS